MMMEEKADSGVKQGVLSLNGLVYQLAPDMSGVEVAYPSVSAAAGTQSSRRDDFRAEHRQ